MSRVSNRAKFGEHVIPYNYDNIELIKWHMKIGKMRSPPKLQENIFSTAILWAARLKIKSEFGRKQTITLPSSAGTCTVSCLHSLPDSRDRNHENDWNFEQVCCTPGSNVISIHVLEKGRLNKLYLRLEARVEPDAHENCDIVQPKTDAARRSMYVITRNEYWQLMFCCYW